MRNRTPPDVPPLSPRPIASTSQPITRVGCARLARGPNSLAARGLSDSSPVPCEEMAACAGADLEEDLGVGRGENPTSETRELPLCGPGFSVDLGDGGHLLRGWVLGVWGKGRPPRTEQKNQ